MILDSSAYLIQPETVIRPHTCQRLGFRLAIQLLEGRSE